MSNNRYFADGTDFWRIHYDLGNGRTLTEGPYIKEYSAKRVMNSNRRLAEERGYDHMKYYLTGKIQKLTPVLDDCMGDAGHEMHLEWVDVNV